MPQFQLGHNSLALNKYMLEGQNLESQDAATTIKVRQMNNRFHF